MLGAIGVGLVVGTLMSIITEYYTAMGKPPVLSIIRQSGTGHATNVIGGLAMGDAIHLPADARSGWRHLGLLCLRRSLWRCHRRRRDDGDHGHAAGKSTPSGPSPTTRAGIAEMSELPKDVREKTRYPRRGRKYHRRDRERFRHCFRSTHGPGPSSPLLSALPVIQGIDIYKAKVLASLFVGGMIPFIFSSLAIQAVGEAAMAMVEESASSVPDHSRHHGRERANLNMTNAWLSSTQASIKKMILPGAIAILFPLIIGFLLGPEALGGFLAGATVCGVLMGIFQNNAGGAWDNAKKSFEKGVEINGEIHYKKSDPHKASRHRRHRGRSFQGYLRSPR